MAQRVSQIPVEVSGAPTGAANLRVSQIPVEVSGIPTVLPTTRVSQIVIEISSLIGPVQTSTYSEANTFPSPGTVATSGIPVIQAATWFNAQDYPNVPPNTLPGGNLDVLTPLPIAQAATWMNTNILSIGLNGDMPGIVAIDPGIPPVTPGTGGGSGTGTGPGTGPGPGTAPAGPTAVLAALLGQKLSPPKPKPLNEYDARLDVANALIESVLYPERTALHPAPGVQSLKGLGEEGIRSRERGIPLIQSARVPGPDSIYVSSTQFFEKGSIVTPLPGNTLVLEFKVPTGYWGKILGMYLHYTGTGFVPGSGDIIWRVQIGSRWMRNFGNVLFPMGSVQNTSPISEWQGLRSQRVVRVWVDVPNGSGLIQVGLSRILVGVQGWFYSNEERIQ